MTASSLKICATHDRSVKLAGPFCHCDFQKFTLHAPQDRPLLNYCAEGPAFRWLGYCLVVSMINQNIEEATVDNRESGWRSQLGFIFSLLLHAGAIALIALGPTILSNEFGNHPEQAKTVDMTIITPPKAPTVAPIVRIAKSPVIAPAKKPAVKKIKIARAVKRPARIKPVIAKPVALQKPKPIIAQAPSVTPPVQKPVMQQPVAQQPVVQQKAVPQKIAAAAASAPTPTAPVKAPQPAASTVTPGTGTAKTITVTQNYLSLRQLPGNQPPNYTRDMRLKREQGSGQLVYFVNKDGTVSDLHLTKSTGYPELDQAAIQAFSKYRFVPGQEGYTVHDFDFVLNGPEVQEAGSLRTSMNN